MPHQTLRHCPACESDGGLHHNFLPPRPNNRPHRCHRLCPVPEIRTAASELFVDELVALFKIADKSIAVLRRHEQVEEKFGIGRRSEVPWSGETTVSSQPSCRSEEHTSE